MKCKLPQRRFENFTDDELYMLSRQAIESSAEIVVLSDSYTEYQRHIHDKILNELLEERKIRDKIYYDKRKNNKGDII